jgi:uncharacterized protein (TIGR00661 family)
MMASRIREPGFRNENYIMKILFGIQATGNGHLSRAKELYYLLKENPNVEQIDVLISGDNSAIDVPFPIKYCFKGISFSYGQSGKVNIWRSFLKANILSVIKGILTVPFHEYDIIISDYEPISVWGAKLRGIHTVGLGNIFSSTSRQFPSMGGSHRITRLFTRLFCPVDQKVAMHYQKFDDFIFTPIIRSEIRAAQVSDDGFTLVYLLSYSEQQLLDVLSQPRFADKRFVVYTGTGHSLHLGHIEVKPLNTESFTRDICRCSGVITAGGFQTTAEALYLGKKLLCIPIRAQFEQQCNARVLQELGITVCRDIDAARISRWLGTGRVVHIDFQDESQKMIDTILHHPSKAA